MSDFCGFIGKTEDEILYSMIDAVKSDGCLEPAFFSDGFVHLGYVPYLPFEHEGIGHNDSYNLWAMVESGCENARLTPKAIISAYEEKGIDFVKELCGTFSIVLWDGTGKRLYLIRDRYGAKPLFYAKTEGGIVFGTKIKAVLQHNSVKKVMNTAAIYEYMSQQSVFLPHTAFREVYHIPGGSYGIYADGKYEEIPYGNPPFGEQSTDSYEEATDKIESLLKQSVKECATGEDLGIFLSGGLDSGLVTALADKGKIRYAFCLKPITGKNSIHRKEEDVRFSELLAKEYGIEHFVWEMTPKDLIENMDNILGSFLQPFSGTMSTYFLAKEASGITKNIITGDGADELFGSYRHHSVLQPLLRYARIKECGESILGREKEFAPYEGQIPFLDGLYQYAGENDTLWYYRLLQMGDGEKSIFLNPEIFGDLIKQQATLRDCVGWDKQLKSEGVLNRGLERDFYHLLPGHTMLYGDTLTRSFGIHLKMPFMNDKLTDYVATLPQEYKIKEGMTKAILREVGKRNLPKEIVFRRKEPFSLPIVEWLKKDLKEYLTDVLCEDSVKKHGLLNAECVQYALKEFYKYPDAKEYYGQMLWTMAMLERWAELCM